MKSTKKRTSRKLPTIAVAIFSVAVCAMAATTITSIINGASASNTVLEVRVEGEAVLPTISSIAPNHGPASGGTLLTFRGAGLNQITSITVGGADCRPIEVITSEQITCTTTAHVSDTVDIVLVTGAGGSVKLPSAFTYDPVLPVVPDTGDEDTGGSGGGGFNILVPNTGLYLFGTSVYVTVFDMIAAVFVVVAIIGFLIYFLYKPKKRTKSALKSKKHHKKTPARAKNTKSRK